MLKTLILCLNEATNVRFLLYHRMICHDSVIVIFFSFSNRFRVHLVWWVSSLIKFNPTTFILVEQQQIFFAQRNAWLKPWLKTALHGKISEACSSDEVPEIYSILAFRLYKRFNVCFALLQLISKFMNTLK